MLQIRVPIELPFIFGTSQKIKRTLLVLFYHGFYVPTWVYLYRTKELYQKECQYRVYMMASANKFLRTYYASVKAYLNSLEPN